MSTVRARFAGSGIAVPPLTVTNDMLARVMETGDDWIRERSGIVTRHYVEPGVGSADIQQATLSRPGSTLTFTPGPSSAHGIQLSKRERGRHAKTDDFWGDDEP